jgi:hypothetical protein
MRAAVVTALIGIVLAAPAYAQDAAKDPFAYCRAKQNTASEEGAPNVIGQAVEPKEPEAVWWKCKNGEVYGCFGGAGGRPCLRWNPSKTPTQSIRQSCARFPNTDVSNSMNDTPYWWKCNGKEPVLNTSNLPQLDKDGYYVGVWKKVSPRK